MSKKVFFYMILDSVGIALTLLCRKWLFTAIGNSFFSGIAIIVINIFCAIIFLIIVFFFLLYWWSDRKWSRIKKRFKIFKKWRKTSLSQFERDVLAKRTAEGLRSAHARGYFSGRPKINVDIVWHFVLETSIATFVRPNTQPRQRF